MHRPDRGYRGPALAAAGCPPGRASFRSAARARGPACARSCAGAGGRSGSVSARWSASSAQSAVTISCYLQSDDEQIQPQRSRCSQRTHRANSILPKGI